MHSPPSDRKAVRRRSRLSQVVFAGSLVALALLILAPPWAPVLLRIEHQTSDWRTALLSDRRADQHPRIAVVMIGEETLADYPYLLPIDRGLLSKTIRALEEAEVRAIGIDLYFARPTESVKDDELLAVLKAKSDAEIVLGVLDERGSLTDRERAYQTNMLEAAGRPSGFLNLRTEPDGVVRYRAGPARDAKVPKSLAASLAEAAGDGKEPGEAWIAWLRPPRGQESPFLTLRAEALFPGTAAHEEATARGEIAMLKDRVVLIGGNFPYLDRHVTPLAALGGDMMPGVFVHAHVLAQIMDGRAFRELSIEQARGLLAGVALAAAALGWLFGARHNHLFGWGVATVALIVVDAILFGQFRVILPFTLMLLAWALGAAAGRSLRIIVSRGAEEGRVLA